MLFLKLQLIQPYDYMEISAEETRDSCVPVAEERSVSWEDTELDARILL